MDNNPVFNFGPDTYTRVKSLQKRVGVVREAIAKAQACGIDCTNPCAACDAMADFLDSLEREFLTPPPRGSIREE